MEQSNDGNASELDNNQLKAMIPEHMLEVEDADSFDGVTNLNYFLKF